jgi:hypothetical protein
VTGPIKNAAVRTGLPQAPVLDTFSDDRPAGRVIGTNGPDGAVRLGADRERRIAIDHGALRFQPLITPGWGRQGIAYGPFRRASGLTLAVSITNGHNTSQGGRIPDSFFNRLRRWASGPDVDGLTARMAACLRGPRRKGLLRRFAWWLRSAGKLYKLPDFNENLAVGWFTSAAPSNPLVDGCGFIVHAAEGENGELWARVGKRCLSAFRRLQNLRIYYVIALRERGAVYYAAATAGAHGVAGFPMMRPIAIDPFNADETLYAGIHQCALGQIGFRVDTRVHGIHIEPMPEFASPFGTAHAGDCMTGRGPLAGASDCGGQWRAVLGKVERGPAGAAAVGGCDALALLYPAAPSGLVHALVEAGEGAAQVGLVWRARGEDSYWLLKVSERNSTLMCVENGVERQVAIDPLRGLKPRATHSIQVLDASGQVGCYLDGERLFDAWFEDGALDGATGVGVWLGGQARIRDFEAHPREVPMPASLGFAAAWMRLGETLRIADGFTGPPGELAGRAPEQAEAIWEKTLGTGTFDVDGAGALRVRATLEEPNPGRTFYTLPWSNPDFADLEVMITPPGRGRGEKHNCRAGLVFWQDNDNYLSFTTFLDDVYNGASIALFTKRHGFEELYDAIWTMVWKDVDWGRPFRMRIAFDGEHFAVYLNGSPIMQRALTDLYPSDPPLRVTRVGLAVNWEWGEDTGSHFHDFKARC